MKLQMEEYEKLELKIETEIVSTKDNLTKLQKSLEEEIEIRDHRIACESVAANVNKYPSRSVLKRKIDQLELNLGKTEDQLKHINNEIVNRKVKFGNMLSSITELQKKMILDDDNNIEEFNEEEDDRHGTDRSERDYNDSNQVTEENEIEIANEDDEPNYVNRW